MIITNTITAITNSHSSVLHSSLLPPSIDDYHKPVLASDSRLKLHTHTHTLRQPPNPQSLLPVFRSWSDTDNFYSNDRSILTLSPIEATHC